MPSAFLLCFLIYFPYFFRPIFVSLLLSFHFYFVHIVFYSSWQTKLLPRPALLSSTSLSEYFADVRFCSSSFCCCCSIHIMQVQQIWFSFFFDFVRLSFVFLLPFFVSCFSAEFSAPFLVIQLGFFLFFLRFSLFAVVDVWERHPLPRTSWSSGTRRNRNFDTPCVVTILSQQSKFIPFVSLLKLWRPAMMNRFNYFGLRKVDGLRLVMPS